MTSWAAPGRVNLIGEHVDYNDGVVLPFALPFVATARVTRRGDNLVQIRSTAYDETVTCDRAVQPGDVSGWAAYVAGVIWALPPEPRAGLDISVHSDIPMGAGLASSAALECAVACAVDEALGLGLDPQTLAAACRRAENDFVGVPTGVMDQLASLLCRVGQALLIDCRTLTHTDVPLDLTGQGLRLLIVDSGVRHELKGSAYASRRAECDAAATALGVGSLRDATLADVRRLTDSVLQRRAHHVVTEIARVREVAEVLTAGNTSEVGAFLTASHESLRDDYEVSCPELDVIVDSALQRGALGSRLTGGGFGGCTIVLCRQTEVGPVIEGVESAFRANRWARPTWWVATPSRGVHRLE
jgi:galactokinase